MFSTLIIAHVGMTDNGLWHSINCGYDRSRIVTFHEMWVRQIMDCGIPSNVGMTDHGL